jgi:hypothetical protein
MVSLKPIKLEYSGTIEVSVEEYIEYCEDYDYTPSQKGYEKFVDEYAVDELFEILEKKVQYGVEKEYELKEKEYELKEKAEEPYDYSKWVSDLDENEIEKFHELCEADKMIINPNFTKDNIVIMCSSENPSLDYGVKIDKETGEILHIKKSIYAHRLYEYLKDT